MNVSIHTESIWRWFWFGNTFFVLFRMDLCCFSWKKRCTLSVSISLFFLYEKVDIQKAEKHTRFQNRRCFFLSLARSLSYSFLISVCLVSSSFVRILWFCLYAFSIMPTCVLFLLFIRWAKLEACQNQTPWSFQHFPLNFVLQYTLSVFFYCCIFLCSFRFLC